MAKSKKSQKSQKSKKSKKSQKSKKGAKKPTMSAEKPVAPRNAALMKPTTPEKQAPPQSLATPPAVVGSATNVKAKPSTEKMDPGKKPSAEKIEPPKKPAVSAEKVEPPKKAAPSAEKTTAGGTATPSATSIYNIENNGPGQALTAEELRKMKEEGKLGIDVDISMNPAMYKVKDDQGREQTVIVVDAPPCGCRKVMGKKERCRKHRALKREKKRSKPKKEKKEPEVKKEPEGKKEADAKKDGPELVRDDDSDRKKVAPLRHAEDSEDENDQSIDGAITPDKICIVGPAGVAILIPIDTLDNPNAGPRAPADAANVTGILIKGPQDCPQFIPDNKIPKDPRGVPKYTKFTVGNLVRNERGEHVFFPEGGCKFTETGKPINMNMEGVDQKVAADVAQKLHLAGVVDVNENGMPIFRQVDQENPAPQDKLATVGVVAEINGDQVFIQTKGQTVGSGDKAAVIPVTREGPQPMGARLAEAIVKDGKVEVVASGQAKEADVVGIVVQGSYNQPVLIAKKGGALDKDGAVTYDPAKLAEMTDEDWKKLAAAQQELQKAAALEIEKNNVNIAAAVTGKTPDQIKKEMAEAKANTEGPNEVISQSIAQGCYNPNRSVFVYRKNTGAAGPAGGGGGNTGIQYAGGEVKSTFAGQDDGAARSVFMK